MQDRIGNFKPEDIDLFQELQWDYAKQIVSRPLTEERAGGAKSVFHFDVQESVAKSTHAGIPWLRFIRQRLGRHPL